MARLKEKYNQEIKNNLQKKLGLSNVMEVPEIKKITVNMGVGEAVQDKKTIEKAVADLEKISGQKPKVYFGDEWFCADGEISISIPFFKKIDCHF